MASTPAQGVHTLTLTRGSGRTRSAMGSVLCPRCVLTISQICGQSDLQATSLPCRLLRVRGHRLAPIRVSRRDPPCSHGWLSRASSRSVPGCSCRSGARGRSEPRVRSMRYASRGRRWVAHLEAVEDTVRAKELAGARVLGGPGEDFVTGGHDRRRGSCTLTS